MTAFDTLPMNRDFIRFSGDLHIAAVPKRRSMGIADATDCCAKIEFSPFPTFSNGERQDGLTPARLARSIKKRPS
jgi:hypothetical protein